MVMVMYYLGFWKFNENIYLDVEDTYNKLSKGEYVEGVSNLDIRKIEADLAALREKLLGVDFTVFTTSQFVKIIFPHFYDGEIMNQFPNLFVDYECPVYDVQYGKRLDKYPLTKGENYYI